MSQERLSRLFFFAILSSSCSQRSPHEADSVRAISTSAPVDTTALMQQASHLFRIDTALGEHLILKSLARTDSGWLVRLWRAPREGSGLSAVGRGGTVLVPPSGEPRLVNIER